MQENKEERTKVRKPGVIKEFMTALWGDRESANERLISLIAGIAFGIAGYFFGKCGLLFSTFPLGIALLCGANRHLPYILIGACLSAPATGLNPAVCIATYAVILIIRVFARLIIDSAKAKPKPKPAESPAGLAENLKAAYRNLFSESVYLRMASACLAAFCFSLYAVIAGGFRYYDLFGAFFSMITAPIATFLFASYFENDLKGTKLRELGILALLTAVSFSLRELTFFGVYVGAFAAFLMTLCVCRRKGILYGCITGLCVGLAFSPVYAPIFILEAAAAGVLWNISALAAATAGCVVGMIWGVYVNGFTALSQLLPALLCGTMVFGAADRLSLITLNPELIRIKTEDKSALEALVKEQITRSDEASIKRLSAMFAELAEAFYNLSDRLRRPGALDLRRMCDSVFDKYCVECPRREVCWGVEYSATLDIINRLTADLHMKARADLSVIPEYLRSRCSALPQIVTEINESCAKLTEHALLCDRTGVFALDYDGVSRILSEALESGREDYIIDECSAASVGEVLKKLRYSFDGVIAYGGRRKSVAVRGLDPSRSRIGVADLRCKLEEAVGVPLSDPILQPNGAKFDLTVGSRRKFAAKQHSFSLTAVGKESENRVCGDTVAGFENGSDYYFALISDGMGAGKEAAFTSRICSMFLEKMLTANNRSETSIRLLNSFMSERDGGARYESSATVDLLEFDLLSGRISVLKSGAAPTYVVRGGNCFKLQSKTVPLGIIDTPDLQRIRFEVEPGDIAVMMSDGVTQNREDCSWLVGMLSEKTAESYDDLAEALVRRARAEGSEDDISVSIIEIIGLSEEN